MLHIISFDQEADACNGEACFDDENEGQHMRPLDALAALTWVRRGSQEIFHNDAAITSKLLRILRYVSWCCGSKLIKDKIIQF